jgi:predicted component of type VI protein secretion system
MREPPPPSAPPPQPQEVARAAQTYLRSRTHQLREDLALGAGPTIEELASLARIHREHLGAFGRLLRAHRQELLALADARALTPQRAVEWMRRVGEIASTDPRLEEDRRAFMVAYESGEIGP